MYMALEKIRLIFFDDEKESNYEKNIMFCKKILKFFL